MRVELMNGINALSKMFQRDTCPFCHVKIQEVYNLKEGPHLAKLSSWSQTSSLLNCEQWIFDVYKPVSLWHFATASWKNWDTLKRTFLGISLFQGGKEISSSCGLSPWFEAKSSWAQSRSEDLQPMYVSVSKSKCFELTAFGVAYYPASLWP